MALKGLAYVLLVVLQARNQQGGLLDAMVGYVDSVRSQYCVSLQTLLKSQPRLMQSPQLLLPGR